MSGQCDVGGDEGEARRLTGLAAAARRHLLQCRQASLAELAQAVFSPPAGAPLTLYTRLTEQLLQVDARFRCGEDGGGRGDGRVRQPLQPRAAGAAVLPASYRLQRRGPGTGSRFCGGGRAADAILRWRHPGGSRHRPATGPPGPRAAPAGAAAAQQSHAGHARARPAAALAARQAHPGGAGEGLRCGWRAAPPRDGRSPPGDAGLRPLAAAAGAG